MYLDTVNGNDSSCGLAEGRPILTMSKATELLRSIHGGTLKVEAPSANPIRDALLWRNEGYDITLEPLVAATDWYWYGSQPLTAGWAAEGGGVYSQAIGTDPDRCFVPTLVDGDGFATTLDKNGGAAPAAGEFDYVGGTLYVHLPGDVDPALHTIEYTVLDSVLSTYGSHGVTVKYATMRYTDEAVAQCGEAFLGGAGGVLTMEDCVTQYGESGVATEDAGTVVVCTRVTSQRNSNDGFNHHNQVGNPPQPTMTLNDCVGSYNGDEGASPHENCILTVNIGTFSNNQQGGITGVDDSEMYLDTVLADSNMEGGAIAHYGGINYKNNCGGTCDDCTCSNNDGPGFVADDILLVAVTNLTSGVAQGNTLPDDT